MDADTCEGEVSAVTCEGCVCAVTSEREVSEEEPLLG